MKEKLGEFNAGNPLKLPAAELLNDILEYNKDTGILTWKYRKLEYFDIHATYGRMVAYKIWNKRFPGVRAFTTKNKGGYRATIFGKNYLAHRIIWKMVYSEEPRTIDHINGDDSDNRLDNLRSVSPAINSKNCKLSKRNKSGTPGVLWRKKDKLWTATTTLNRKIISLGCYKNKEDAIAARKAANKEYGYHENHGRKA
jgi:hypothetical protein